MTRIFAVDPGASRSGVCILELTENNCALETYREVHGGVEGFIDYLDLYGGGIQADVIVVEGYEIRRGQAGDPHGLEVIGAIKYWARHRAPVVTQTPAGRKKAVSDDALQRLGLYLPGEPWRNAREAIRHAVWYAKKQKHTPTLRIGWPQP